MARFEKGQTGNPNGRPTKARILEDDILKSIASDLNKVSPEALKNVIRVMRKAKAENNIELLLKTSQWIVGQTVVVSKEIERRGQTSELSTSNSEDDKPVVLSLTVS